jgi:hypothetical protein
MTFKSIVIVAAAALLLAMGAMVAAHTSGAGFLHDFVRHLHGR